MGGLGGKSVHACRSHEGRSLTHSTLSGVRADKGRPCGLLSVTDPSWCHFNIHNIRVLWLGESRLWTCWRKPHCVTATDCFDKEPTAAIRCCTDRRSISTKLYVMTVRRKAACSWHAGFRISKNIRCFWCTLISVYVEVASKTTAERQNVSSHLSGIVITQFKFI